MREIEKSERQGRRKTKIRNHDEEEAGKLTRKIAR